MAMGALWLTMFMETLSYKLFMEDSDTADTVYLPTPALYMGHYGSVCGRAPAGAIGAEPAHKKMYNSMKKRIHHV